MRYIIAFLFSILTIIKPLECSLEIQFCDGIELSVRIVGNFTLCGDSRESMITLADYLIINRNNLEHPLAGITQIKLTQGIAKVGNTVKTAPAIFNAIYVDSNNLSTFIKSQADNFARIFRNGKYFRHEEEEYDLCNLIFKSNPNVSTEIIAEHFSAEQAQVLYQIWSHRPGADFTQAEFDKAMAMISAAENKTQDGYLAELQKNFSEARTLALYQNWPHRPGSDCTKTDFDKAIKLLRNAPNKIEADCLTELQKYFSFERAQALHQGWSYRPGADFTGAEFDKAMEMISAAENKTQNGYLAELQRNFPEPRALALYQNWPHRPGDNFTGEEFVRAIKLLRNAPNEAEAACLAELQKYFSFERALAIYQNSPYRPGDNFTQAEFDRALSIMYASKSKTQYGYLCALLKSFSRERALALSLYDRWLPRPGALPEFVAPARY